MVVRMAKGTVEIQDDLDREPVLVLAGVHQFSSVSVVMRRACFAKLVLIDDAVLEGVAIVREGELRPQSAQRHRSPVGVRPSVRTVEPTNQQ